MKSNRFGVQAGRCALAAAFVVGVHGAVDAQSVLRTLSESHVAAAGDVNGDGFDDLMVRDSVTANTVRIVSGQDGSDIWVLSAGSSGASFGAGLAGGVDCDGDGYPDLLIGAPNDVSAGGANPGSVRLYSGRTGNLLLTLHGSMGTTHMGSGFGSAIAFLRSTTPTSTRILVGIQTTNSSAGAAQVFSSQTPTVFNEWLGGVSPWTGLGDNYGTAVAGADTNGDGVDEAYVSAPAYDAPVGTCCYRPDTGMVVRDNTTIVAVGTQSSELSGQSLVNAGDLDGDGLDDLLLGEPGYIAVSTQVGRMRGMKGNVLNTPIVAVVGPIASSVFGNRVTAIADYDGDGLRDIMTANSFTSAGLSRVYVHSSATGANLLTIIDFPTGSGLGSRLADVGDVNADGSSDFFVAGQTSTIYSSVSCTTCYPPGVSFCLGNDFTLNPTCPCSNWSAYQAGSGCANSTTNGGRLTGAGTASVMGDTLVLTVDGVPATANCLFFQGTVTTAVPFGDGVRCVAAPNIRLGTSNAVAGVTSYPQAGDPSISVKGAVTPGLTYYYQVEYRDSASFCMPSTLSMSSAYSVLWLP